MNPEQLTLIASPLPPPPYPADVLANGWHFELAPSRIENSDTWVLLPASARPWLLMMHFQAWQQAPCGSLPREGIADLIGMPQALWHEHAATMLREWWLASDGRRYHADQIKRVERMRLARLGHGYRRHFDAVISRCGARCWYCSAEPPDLTLDHVFPRSRGGSDDPENLVPACKSCNSSKGARTPEEWLE